ncbi:MAG: ACT domain-containing protein, partial [Chloroflexota bacterium]
RKDSRVTVHSIGCRLLAPDEIRGRCLKLRWGAEQQENAFARQVSFQITAFDRDGLLHEITHFMRDESINISNIWSHTVSYKATIVFSAEMKSPRQVISFLHRVLELSNVTQATYLGRTSEDHIIPERFFSSIASKPQSMPSPSAD